MGNEDIKFGQSGADTIQEKAFLLVEQAETRLDKYLVRKYPELSRSRVQHLIAEGKVAVNDHLAKPSLKLFPGDKVCVSDFLSAPPALVAEDIPLRVVYEDDDLIVIDKPAGIPMHPSPGHPDHTLVNALLAHCPVAASSEAPLRPGIVHRLDKDTSGLVVAAKTQKAHAWLASQFKSQLVHKAYLALVRGHLSPEQGRIEAPIGRDPRNRKRMAVVSTGREATTEYKVLRYLPDYTMLQVNPKTGRTHQIRVHLSAIGHAVAGDTVYGVKSPYFKRQFLHAFRLGFHLPSTGSYSEFTSPLPPELEEELRNVIGEHDPMLPATAETSEERPLPVQPFGKNSPNKKQHSAEHKNQGKENTRNQS